MDSILLEVPKCIELKAHYQINLKKKTFWNECDFEI